MDDDNDRVPAFSWISAPSSNASHSTCASTLPPTSTKNKKWSCSTEQVGCFFKCHILAPGVLNQSKFEDLVNQMTEKFRDRIRHLTRISALITLIGIGGFATGALLDQFIFNPPDVSAAERPCEYNTCMSECEWVEPGSHLSCGPGEICYLVSDDRSNCSMRSDGSCSSSSCRWWQ